MGRMGEFVHYLYSGRESRKDAGSLYITCTVGGKVGMIWGVCAITVCAVTVCAVPVQLEGT